VVSPAAMRSRNERVLAWNSSGVKDEYSAAKRLTASSTDLWRLKSRTDFGLNNFSISFMTGRNLSL
jgi:hypothetical protein